MLANSSALDLATTRVLAIVEQIPRGKVATYKQIAQLAQLKNPRHVGRILRISPLAAKYPCHRVVRSNGTLAEGNLFGEEYGQLKKLRAEGILFEGGRVKLNKYQWSA
ncbi:MAG: MGMT family protein [bacterium]|nr:MGMT family protein [bacterium]